MSRPRVLYRENEGWQRWNGGACPVHAETVVKPWFASVGEAKHTYQAQQLFWGKRIDPADGKRLPGDILGYLVVQEAQS